MARTHCIYHAQQKKVVIGSFLNLTALGNWLKNQQENILLVCAGWKNNFNLEDTLFAGAIMDQLKSENYQPDDSTIAANDLYQLGKSNLNKYLQKTAHSERLKKLGIEEDIRFCLQCDLTTTIPILQGEKLVKLI